MKAKYIIFAVATLLITGSCNDFLSTEDLTKKDNSNFPRTEKDASKSLTGCYAMLRNMTDDNEGQNIFIVSEVLSDDRFGGGGPDDRYAQALDHLKKSSDNMFSDLWKINYKGIYRCNMLLESLPQISFNSQQSHDQVEGEARFLRAYFYFNLMKTFGHIPLIPTSQSGNEPQAEPEKVYAQIATDLRKAIDLLPDTKADVAPDTQLGHATRWAAEGMLARVFLFYTGYYQKEALPTIDGSLSKADVAALLKDCIDHSGHKL